MWQFYSLVIAVNSNPSCNKMKDQSSFLNKPVHFTNIY